MNCRIRHCSLPAALCLLLVAGCGKNTSPRFHLNMQGKNPADFAPGVKDNEQRIKGRQDIATALYAMFGTPDDPYVFPESGLDLAKVQMAAGPAGGNADGTQRGLYRRHCVHCHGITGDGAGPTAQFLMPYPRDYRRGLYKFKSTERSAKPTHADLKRVLLDGIAGTAMPSFALLPDDEVEALVEYVKYLSIRGEVELAMGITVYNEEDALDMSHDGLAKYVSDVANGQYGWAAAEQQVIQVPDHPQVADRNQWLAAGEALFRGPKAQCMKCHGPTALGDGSEVALFDDWNKDKRQAELERIISEERAKGEEVGKLQNDLHISLHTYLLPEQQVQPRNLRLGIYRFGRSPADMYRRVHAGINGTPMPGGFIKAGNPANLKPEEIWQIIDYIRTLPYTGMDPALGNAITLNKARN
ncbi:MAG TPA: cytochrome c [Pirellulales bacterium]|nr:cytochrome c [Pirellulales bacterium]